MKESDPTAGGDAPVVETRKIDCTENTISGSTVKCTECTDVVPENAVVPEEAVATSTLSAQIEAESSAEVTNSANVLLAEEIANSDTHSAETTDTTADIVHAVPENVIDVQKPAHTEVEDLTACILQSEERLQKLIIEEKVKKICNNILINFYYFK